MKQQTLTGFEKYGQTTRRAKFLADMDRTIPSPEMTAAAATVYPKISEQGGTIVDATIIGAPSSKTKLIHTILASAASVSDVDALPYLRHGRETRAWGDQGYQGQTDVICARAPRAKDFTNREYRGRGRGKEVEKKNTKSQGTAKVEHTIGVIQRVFGLQKVRYRGLTKNLHHLEVTAALANPYTVRRRLLRA